MPCVTHVTLWVFTLSGSPHRLAGWLVVYAVGCPWHQIVGSCGAVLCRAVVSVDELYEALPFRQCRAFFLKCRCGWAGWVSAWAGVKWGCMGACVPCLGVVSSDAIKWAVCGFLASCCVCGYMCVRMGCKRLVEGFIMVCWCPNSMWCLCGSVGVCTCIWGYYLGLVLASLCCGWLCRDGLV